MTENVKNFEFEGPTVEATIKIAIGKLRVRRDDINIKIISEEKKGLFGMNGAKLAKIIVTLKNGNNKS